MFQRKTKKKKETNDEAKKYSLMNDETAAF